MSFGLGAFLVLTLFNFGIAAGYRIQYEKNIKKKTVTSYQLDRLVALEQIYIVFGIIAALITIFLSISKYM